MTAWMWTRTKCIIYFFVLDKNQDNWTTSVNKSLGFPTYIQLLQESENPVFFKKKVVVGGELK